MNNTIQEVSVELHDWRDEQAAWNNRVLRPALNNDQKSDENQGRREDQKRRGQTG